MSVEDALSDYFKPEERKRGRDLLAKDVVLISSASDTDVRGFIKASGACKVTLAAEDVGSSAFTAVCTCPVSRKGNLCRHVWAVLLKLEEKGYDFLESKAEVSMYSSPQISEPGTSYADKQRLRQKKRLESPVTAFRYPDPVEEARAYFEANGFPLNHPLELDELLNAKKLLSRVFHPDKGGTHDEIIQLNENFEIIYGYLKD